MNKILQSFDQMNISESQKEELLSKKLIYFCPQHNLYHITNGHSWADIENTIF